MPVALISRGTMSGVKMLVECLRDHLGYRCVAREDLIALLDQHGELATRIVENLRTATRAYESFSQLRRPFLILMRLALLQCASEGDLVYHGYSGHLLVPHIRHFIRIRINAPMELRVRMFRAGRDGTEEEAREYILEEDERRVKWARFMYGRDVRDPALYDVAVNLDRMTMKSVCGLIQRLMEDADFQPTPESEEQVRRLLLAAKVEAALATDSRTTALEIGATVREDGIDLVGPYLEGEELDTVLEIAGAAAETRGVRYTPGFVPPLGFETREPASGTTASQK